MNRRPTRQVARQQPQGQPGSSQSGSQSHDTGCRFSTVLEMAVTSLLRLSTSGLARARGSLRLVVLQPWRPGWSLKAPFTVGWDPGLVGEDGGRGFGRPKVGVEQADEQEANGAADELSGDEAGC
jgi:hypothetical protein